MFFMRSTMRTVPSASRRPMSPVWKKPSASTLSLRQSVEWTRGVVGKSVEEAVSRTLSARTLPAWGAHAQPVKAPACSCSRIAAAARTQTTPRDFATTGRLQHSAGCNSPEGLPAAASRSTALQHAHTSALLGLLLVLVVGGEDAVSLQAHLACSDHM
eukprot:365508-Chlamydomonas_euryale.AAC.2